MTVTLLNFPPPGPTSAAALLLLSHGAGAPMDSAFMEVMAVEVAARGVTVVRFEFDYMTRRRLDQKKRPPANMVLLTDEFRAAAADARMRFPAVPLLIGGKSMGGRVASMIADALFLDSTIVGCVCLGYPFHAATHPDKPRTTHLVGLQCPTLIVQGTRDALGSHAAVERMALSKAITFEWLEDGNHDFVPRMASGTTHKRHLQSAASAVATFAQSRQPRPPV